MTELDDFIGTMENVYSEKSRYTRQIKGVDVDVYDILVAFNVINPATAHAIKKLMMPGERGQKDVITDLEEAKASIERAIELECKNV